MLRIQSIKPDRLRGFWSDSATSVKYPCRSRPDLVDARNRTTDRAPRGERNIYSRSRRDCGVRALAICGNVPYNVAYGLLEDRGREKDGLTFVDQILESLRELRFTVAETTVTSRTLVTLERELKHGIYYVHVTGHSLALIDGRIWDGERGRRMRVIAVYKVEALI